MSFLDRIMGRSAPADIAAPDVPAAVQAMVAVIARPVVNTHALTASSLRTGMWVMSPSGIGILTGCRIDGMGEVTLCKADGSTRMALDASDKAAPLVLTCELAQVAQAGILDIPESRRGDVDTLRAMGYK